ncbi:large ribosomal subunit protein uL29m-like [Antedon mediterranea]|uniref:large ribosomal subunit protein uL29m-like n=1 Tax=Antedon mediterranea TaxID=105859 RepID=UPI003AF856F9
MQRCLSKGKLLFQCINWSTFVRLKEKASTVMLNQKFSVSPCLTASFNTSSRLHGLEEFFEDEEKRGEQVIKHGRAWSIEELRLKDNADLHKLWYILLKERNLLFTLDEECERLDKIMPSPERLEKVDDSMNALERVIKERNTAVNELETGYKRGKPGRWIASPLGYRRYAHAREHYVPLHVNKKIARKRNFYYPWTQAYKMIYLEQALKTFKREATRERNRIRKLKKRFPDADID